jgi:hypothetical protein
MKITVDEMCNTHTTGYKDHLVESHVVEADTLEECFKKAYPYERSLRYCSGYFIHIREEGLHEKYLEWKQNGVTMEMFYGGFVYD